MRLQRLTGLERDKIEGEFQDLVKLIAELKAILADEEKVLEIIREELSEIKDKFNDERRTSISMDLQNIEDEDLIPQKNIVITITHNGYIKRLPIETYRLQKRGGRGIQGMGTNEDDFVEQLLTTNTHHTVLFFTNKGKVYRLKGYEIPEFGRTAKGIPIINLLQIEQDETVSAVIPVETFDSDHFLFFTTKCGISKRSDLASFANIRKGGLIAVNLREEDELIGVRLTDGEQDIIMGTRSGKAIRFHESDVRVMGRTATGVKGISLGEDDEVIGMGILEGEEDILVVTENGYGKRTPAGDYRVQTRGGKGLITCNITEKNGPIVALKPVSIDDDLMIISVSGVIIRTEVSGISVTGRNTQGVKVIRVNEGEKVATVARVMKEEDEEDSIEEDSIEEESIEDGESGE